MPIINDFGLNRVFCNIFNTDDNYRKDFRICLQGRLPKRVGKWKFIYRSFYFSETSFIKIQLQKIA